MPDSDSFNRNHDIERPGDLFLSPSGIGGLFDLLLAPRAFPLYYFHFWLAGDAH